MKRHINRSKRVSNLCRNNNYCPYCRASRLHSACRRIDQARRETETGVEDYYGDIEDGFTNYSILRCHEEVRR